MANKQSFQGFFKEGTRYFQGTDEVLLRNIDAVIDLSELTRTSIGPNGMKKIIKNHFDKLFVTGDAAAIINEAEIQHPAAKMLVSASEMQAKQIGDGTNFVIVFAGELLRKSVELIRMGIHARDIVAGYQAALAQSIIILNSISFDLFDPTNVEKTKLSIRTSLSSHQYLDSEFLSGLVATACQNAYVPGNKFNVDNVRVAKSLGGSVEDSYVVKGFVVRREVMGSIRKVVNARIAVYATGFELGQTDTKMATIFTSGKEMENFEVSEEERMENVVKSIVERGVNVIVCQSKISELAMHYFEKYQCMGLQIASRFDLQRACRAAHAIPLLRIGTPTDDEIGSCALVQVLEVGSTPLVTFESDGNLSTIVIRGSTQNIIDDVERSIEDAVNSFQILTEFPKLVAGAGASEMEVSVQITKWAESRPGMDQYGARKFAESLEVIPRTIAENSGIKIAPFLAKIRAAHSKGQKNSGVDVINLDLEDATKLQVYDVLHVKEWALKFSTEVVCTLLRIDQIALSKPAQGPAPRTMGARDED